MSNFTRGSRVVDMMIIINDPVATGTNHKKTLNVCWSQRLVCTVNCVGEENVLSYSFTEVK